MGVVRGRIKWLSKGRGFIEVFGKEVIYVYYSIFNEKEYNALKEGQYIEFMCLNTLNGNYIYNISILDFNSVL